jgi:ATP/maltotriose-dependent transcriptional regulator MalT
VLQTKRSLVGWVFRFHTAKFHVAAILAKLDADSRTEAVAKAAQAGLVML